MPGRTRGDQGICHGPPPSGNIASFIDDAQCIDLGGVGSFIGISIILRLLIETPSFPPISRPDDSILSPTVGKPYWHDTIPDFAENFSTVVPFGYGRHPLRSHGSSQRMGIVQG